MVKTTNTPAMPAFPELENAKSRLARMLETRDENAKETKLLLAELNGACNGSNFERQVSAAAARLLEDEELAAVPDVSASLNDALKKRWQEREVIDRAVGLAEHQVHTARSAACKQLAEKLGPTYAAILARMKSALLELRKAAIDELAFREGLAEAGFDGVFGSYLRAMPYEGAGWVEPGGDRDAVGIVDLWLAELAEYYPNVK